MLQRLMAGEMDDKDGRPMPAETSGSEPRPDPRYWRANLRLTGLLLGVWWVVSFVFTYFARDLDFTLFGWPFSVWLASQGALIVYGLLIAGYARRMDRLDREHGVAEQP